MAVSHGDSTCSSTCSNLQTEFSLLEEEFFGNRLEEIEAITNDDSGEGTEGDGEALNFPQAEPREIDVKEVEDVKNFIHSTCGCSKKNGAPCSGFFDQDEYEEARMSMAELEKDQLDLVILSQINAHHFSGQLAGHGRKSVRVKEYTNFHYKSHSICLMTFLFLHGIGKKRFRNLMKHYQLNGLTVRTHANVHKLPWNASTIEDKERAVTFIKNFAEANSLPLPGRMPKFHDYNIMLLPTDASKTSVHRAYIKSSKELEQKSGTPVRIFGYREFCRLWSEVVPFIRSMPPADDLCFTCQSNSMLIMKSANLSEDEKTEKLLLAQQHLEVAKKQRHYYRDKVAASKSAMEQLKSSKSVTLSYSFDHAQQIHYPSRPQNPGTLYFKAPRKCGIFGVCDEGNSTQLNFLIDEAQACGKGANSIVSMVHYYLQYYSHGEESICLQADNCVGQNKNNTMAFYLAWRVATGLSKSCELSFMIPGHTKFSPDRFFGLIKRKYRHTDVSSLAEISKLVEESTKGGQNRALIIGSEPLSQRFHYYDWSEYLCKYYKAIPQITSYHHFCFSQEYPGKVALREFADTKETKVIILRKDVTIDPTALPSILPPSGLSEERKQYLYNEIRVFCAEKYRDITCPEPTRKHPLNKPDSTGPLTKKYKRLCSHCRNPGHTKTRKGQIICPELLKN